MVGISPTAVAVAAGNEVRAIFSDALDTLREGEAQYLVGGEPTSITGAISQAAGRSACRIYGTGNIELNATAAERYERVCRPYLDTITPGQGASIGVPFDGGQCDAQGYLVVVSWLNDTTGVRQVFSSTIFGPLGGVRISNPSGTNNVLEINCRGRRPASSCDALPTALVAQQWFPVANSAGLRSGASVDSVSPCGFADDCGNPPPEVTQPGPIADPQPPPFRLPPGPPGSPDVDIDVDVELFPDGTISFNIGTGPVTIDPFGGEDGGGGSDGDGGGGAAGGDGLPGDPTAVNAPAFVGEPGGDGENVDFGPPPTGKVWVGCLARFLVLGGVGTVPGSGPSNRAYTRVVGNLSLRYGSERGEARQVRSEWNESFRPVTALQVTGVFVNSLPQATVTIFPVAATICPESTCEASDG